MRRMKKHLPLILGIGLPALFLVAVLLVSLAPRLGPKPAHDALLSSDDYRYGGGDYTYEVKDGHLTRQPNEAALLEWHYEGGSSYQARREPDPTRAPKFYRYSFADQTVRLVSFEDATKLSLDPGPSSDDGFSVGGSDYYGGGLLVEIVGGRSGRGATFPLYRNGKLVERVSVPSGLASYGSPSFVAWIN